jgi:hypothetical protein
MEEFDTLRDALQEDYLPALRSVLAGSKPLPPIYESVARIPFRHFATTNLDELLYVTATVIRRDAEETVWVYPDPETIGAKTYFYLHGRLETAKGPNDLVLCASDYHLAYDLSGGPAWAALQQLTSGPILFVGSSLDDPDIKRLLEVQQRLRLVRVRLGGQWAERYSRQPWFAILPAKPDERFVNVPAMLEWQRDQFTGFTPIWYSYDTEHRGLDELLLRLERAGRVQVASQRDFIEIAADLEELGKLMDPKPPDIAEVKRLLMAPSHRQHFFRMASSSWFPILMESDLITPSVPEPVEGPDGPVAEYWDAAEFVVRAGPLYPEAALSMLQGIETRNWLVVEALGRMLLAFPSEHLSGALQFVEEWLVLRDAYCDNSQVNRYA